MSNKNDGGAAFPRLPIMLTQPDGAKVPQDPGMSLRDYFAAKAMATLLGSEYTSGHGLYEGWPKALAHEAYLIADAMLAAREVKS